MWRRWVVVVITLGPAVAWAQALRPFTPVASVCPTCTTGPKYDRVVLRGGGEVRARVVAENDRFYVLEKFGELRALGKDQAQTVEKDPSVARAAGLDDQILERDGTVLAGTLKSDADPLVITVPISGTEHTVYRSQVTSAFKGGKGIMP